ncbi:hypothetical protein GGX14DRAFT_372560 [Mycena pura]|uniref:Uncharacterized protein n=1 Tax=Mycena pura TaxID=153505 RepID=A0AAD6Y3Z7_9AGAR|nr:hypothetical protein GGX14DRAFT_372560 [Mycena pura]
MPHKRAKRSIREEQRVQKGADLAPRLRADGDALSSEPLPKSFARAINAAQVRADYRSKRKLQEEDAQAGDDKKTKRRKLETATQIRPGETLAHFNKRIEADMRPLVRSAVQTSLAAIRALKKDTSVSASKSAKPSDSRPLEGSAPVAPASKGKSKPTAEPEPEDKHASRPKEFARTSTSAPRRLNDIATAPPDLSSLTRRVQSKSKSNAAAQGKEAKNTGKASVLSPAQQLQMAAAREEAISRYRELRAARHSGGD